MNKQYTIEVPVNSSPMSHLAELNRRAGIRINVFGGIPNSPLNGGRNNFILDRQYLFGRYIFSITKGQLATAVRCFYENIDKANSNGMPFYLAVTNIFVSPEELNAENLSPLDRLVGFSRKYGVKNGLILNNKLLEEHIRQKYGNELVYVSSCTKYCSPERILSPNETLTMYRNDVPRYDFVVLTPQDSRREELIKEVVRENPHKIIAICNSCCSDNCNCYHHYEFMSCENKKSLLDLKAGDVLIRGMLFTIPRMKTCGAIRAAFRRSNYKPVAEMQLRSGVVHFKVGRGLGDDFLGELVALIQKF